MILSAPINSAGAAPVDSALLWFGLALVILLLVAIAVQQFILRRRLQRQEQEIRDRTELFAAALRSSLDAVFLLKSVRAGGVIIDFTFAEVNLRAEQLVNLSRDQLVGNSLCTLFPINRTGGFLDRYAAIVETGTPLDEEFPINTPELAAQWLHHQVVKVGDGIMITTRDISEARRVQAELINAEKTKVIGQLAEGVIHDFRNLLLVLSANLELVARAVPPAHDARPSLRLMEAAVQQGNDLTESLLLLSRRSPSAPEILSLHALINLISARTRKSLPPDIELHVDPGQPDWHVLASQTEVQHCLLSLMLNAREAMPDGGLLSLSVTGDSAAQHAVFCIQVSDTGVGMSPDLLARATEPYFTTKPRGQGTGLGLALVRGVIDSLHGTLDIQSEPNRGTTVTIRVPAAAAPLSHLVQPRRDLDAQPALALILEPDPHVRATYSSMLAALGYQSHPCSDLAELLHTVEQSAEPALVLLRQPPPGTDADMRALCALPQARPIIMIASPDASGTQLPAANILTLHKPFRQNDLAALLATIEA